MIIIGITGTLGAGKGAVVECLKNKGFIHFPVRNFMLEELKRRELPLNRDVMTATANDLRAKHSPSYIIEQLYAQAVQQNENCIIESVRVIGELEFLKKQKVFYLIAIDADQKMRYERIVSRKSELDHVTFEKFVYNEEEEMNSKESTKGNISECMRRADFKIENNGTLEELNFKVEEILRIILK